MTGIDHRDVGGLRKSDRKRQEEIGVAETESFTKILQGPNEAYTDFL